MEESEVCSLPGGFASVRKHFEMQEAASSHNVTQFHFHHRTVQVDHGLHVRQAQSMRQMTVGVKTVAALALFLVVPLH